MTRPPLNMTVYAALADIGRLVPAVFRTQSAPEVRIRGVVMKDDKPRAVEVTVASDDGFRTGTVSMTGMEPHDWNYIRIGSSNEYGVYASIEFYSEEADDPRDGFEFEIEGGMDELLGFAPDAGTGAEAGQVLAPRAVQRRLEDVGGLTPDPNPSLYRRDTGLPSQVRLKALGVLADGGWHGTRNIIEEIGLSGSDGKSAESVLRESMYQFVRDGTVERYPPAVKGRHFLGELQYRLAKKEASA